MRVTKMHGCGNDFVVVADLDDALDLDAAAVRALCDRHTGVGGDGVIRLAPAQGPGSDIVMDYRNADGGVAEMCGNGVRCVATYACNRGLVTGEVVRVATRAGVKAVAVTARDADGRVIETRVDMGPPRPTGTVPLRLPALDGVASRDVTATTVSMGNPHAVIAVDDVRTVPVARWGPHVEHLSVFPEGTNVEFIEVPAADVVRGRIWERGVGETRASGTGASAMAVAAHLTGRVGRDVRVEVPGGVLHASWGPDTLTIRGPAVEVFDAELAPTWREAVVHA